jgi:hypothetical protein
VASLQLAKSSSWAVRFRASFETLQSCTIANRKEILTPADANDLTPAIVSPFPCALLRPPDAALYRGAEPAKDAAAARPSWIKDMMV